MDEYKVLVLYRTKHGSTKKYANWIGDALNGDVIDAKVPGWENKLSGYDMIIYGGNLDVSGINGLAKIRAKMESHRSIPIVYFAVGSFPPSEDTIDELLASNFPEHLRSTTKLFHLRGRLDYLGLNFWDKFMMRGVQKRILDRKEEQRTPTENEILLAFEQEMNWCDKETIGPLVDYVKSFMTPEQLEAAEEKAAYRMMETAKREEEEAIAWAEEMKRREALYLEREKQEQELKLRKLTKKQRAQYEENKRRREALERAAREDDSDSDFADDYESGDSADDDYFDRDIPENEFSDDYSDFHDDEKK